MKKYSWSFNRYDEVWSNGSYDTVGECIAAAIGENINNDNLYEMIYIGENVRFIPSVDAESVLYELQEDAFEECGEEWGAYDPNKLDELEELRDRLTDDVSDWLDKYGYTPELYIIDNIQPYMIG